MKPYFIAAASLALAPFVAACSHNRPADDPTGQTVVLGHYDWTSNNTEHRFSALIQWEKNNAFTLAYKAVCQPFGHGEVPVVIQVGTPQEIKEFSESKISVTACIPNSNGKTARRLYKLKKRVSGLEFPSGAAAGGELARQLKGAPLGSQGVLRFNTKIAAATVICTKVSPIAANCTTYTINNSPDALGLPPGIYASGLPAQRVSSYGLTL